MKYASTQHLLALMPENPLETPHPAGAGLLANLLKIFAGKPAPTRVFRPNGLPGLMLILLCGAMVSGTSTASESTGVSARGRSTGCGISRTGTGDFVPVKVRILDKDRTYHLRIPSTYDPNRAYPLVFRWHGYGGTGTGGGLDIEYSSGNDAIVVGPDGINKYWSVKTDAANLQFFDRMLETIESQYCIDRSRIFSYGYSAGSFFSNFLACERGDILRANAVIAGGLRGGNRKGRVATWLLDTMDASGAISGSDNCKGRVATWFLHDQDDESVPIVKGKAARERALAINGCSTKTLDEGDGCVRYQGCEAAPVVWCETKGIGHNIRGDFAPPRVWKFFQQLASPGLAPPH